MLMSRHQGVFIAVSCAIALAGCDHFDVHTATDHLPPYQVREDRPRTIIDVALDACPDKTVAKETACVGQALREQAVGVPGLIAMVQNCSAGHVCVYRHTSEDRLGFIPATAEHFVVHWALTFDLAKPAALAADVPLTIAVE